MDQYQNAFQMLGQNMFSKAPPSGYSNGYQPMIQANSNKQKFDQLIQLMQFQEQTVSDYNTRMKGKEDHIYSLEQQSMQLQRDLVQKDKQRNEHNQINYKNYQPTFNVQNTLPIEQLQTDLQSVQNQNQNNLIQAVDNPEIQPQYIQRRTSIQSNQNQTRPQSYAIQGNQKLLNMQKQMEEQNQYIQQLSALVSKKKPVIDADKDDSLTQLLNERDDLQKQQILNEIKQLKQRVDEFDHSRQQMIPQQLQQQGFMPQQQLMQQQGMMQFQNPYGMYPQMYPPNIQQQQQQQNDELDDNEMNNEILMKLIDQQNIQKKRGSRNRQNSHDYNHRDQRKDRRNTHKRKQQQYDDDQNNDGDSN
ncbi:unnamed protein product [Paramecium primaurelia]|uniref:Uncharacterized protein n=1 Tax=Paramecium primaurelia TaxID=5886 RepID=A0A8S1NF87_PARPR|nr:unnamed protein product [Paramecium primaurelia]